MQSTRQATDGSRLLLSLPLGQLGFAGLFALCMAPPFAWLFQHELAAGVVGTALLAAGTSYLTVRKQNTIPKVGAVAVAFVVAGAAAAVAWLLRFLWGPWVA